MVRYILTKVQSLPPYKLYYKHTYVIRYFFGIMVSALKCKQVGIYSKLLFSFDLS